MKSHATKIQFLIFLSLVMIVYSCDQAEDLFLSDSEKLMKDLKGNYTLTSVRHEEYYSVNGGVDWILNVDTTYSATGSFNIATVDMADYTGTLALNYLGYNEAHNVNGSAVYDSDYERLYVITDGGENIAPLILFNPPANYLQASIEERSKDKLILMFGEESWDSSARKYRYLRFEKSK
jgi:hypothetical protein